MSGVEFSLLHCLEFLNCLTFPFYSVLSVFQGGRKVDFVHVKRGVVIVSQDLREMIEIAKLANLRSFVEDAWRLERAKKKQQKDVRVKLKTTQKERILVGRLLKCVTNACWPGLTNFGLVPWPSDTGNVTATSLPYNAFRYNVLLGKFTCIALRGCLLTCMPLV